MILIKNPIVSVQWLHENLNASNIIILDASIKKVTESNLDQEDEQIPNARFFDIKNTFSDVSASFPNTFPSVEQFTSEAQRLGINKENAIVIYDDKGIYSSPRAWYLFKAFGFNNVAVLDGGLPQWEKANYKIELKQNYKRIKGDFEAEYQPSLMRFFEDVKKASQDEDQIIIDARSESRFKALVKEPRKGLRSGSIPSSLNLPFANLLHDGETLKSKEELQRLFKEFAKFDDPIIFSCGTGITACILALGANIVGYNNTSVYDGSWTEWGSLTHE